MLRYVEKAAREYRNWYLDIIRAPDPLEMMDAAYECPHGHLPSDKNIKCTCYKGGE
jgi:hypothetical protein